MLPEANPITPTTRPPDVNGTPTTEPKTCPLLPPPLQDHQVHHAEEQRQHDQEVDGEELRPAEQRGAVPERVQTNGGQVAGDRRQDLQRLRRRPRGDADPDAGEHREQRVRERREDTTQEERRDDTLAVPVAEAVVGESVFSRLTRGVRMTHCLASAFKVHHSTHPIRVI